MSGGRLLDEQTQLRPLPAGLAGLYEQKCELVVEPYPLERDDYRASRRLTIKVRSYLSDRRADEWEGPSPAIPPRRMGAEGPREADGRDCCPDGAGEAKRRQHPAGGGRTR